MGLNGILPTWLLRTIQIGSFLAIVALLWWSVDWRASAKLLATANVLWLGAAALALNLQTVLSALRWRLTAQRLGIVLSTGEAIREYYLSQLVNQSLPGGVVGDAGRAVRARGQAGLLASGQAVVFERLAGQLGLLAVLAAGLLAAVFVPSGMNWPQGMTENHSWFLIAVAVLSIGTVLAYRLVRQSDTVLQRFGRAFSHSVLARDVLAIQAVLSLATAICNVGAFAFCAAALGVHLTIISAATLIPLILFAMILPLSISGWGLREGAAAALFPVIGASTSEGLAASVAFGLVFLATVLPGLVLSWLRPNVPVVRPGGSPYK